MKIRIVMITVTVFVAAGLYFYFRQSSSEKVAHEVLAGNYPSEKKVELTPELRAFVGWYEPMVKDASKEVSDIMRRFDPKFRSRSGHRDKELEAIIPTDEWIQRLLDMGIKIESYDDYSDYLTDRYYAYHAATDPESLQDMKDRHGLEPDAFFDEVITADIRENVMFKQLLDQAMADDPQVYGGEISSDGVFLPYRRKTVYVQKGTITAGTGVPKWVVYEPENRDIGLSPSREIPGDIDVIHLDEKGQPIKDRVPPSVSEFERFSNSESDTVFESIREQPLGENDFADSFPDDLSPSARASYDLEESKIPQSVADLEKQFSPERIKAKLSESLSPDSFDKAQKLIGQYGTAEGLRRLREVDPEAARRFERGHPHQSPRKQGDDRTPDRDAPKSHTHPDNQSPIGDLQTEMIRRSGQSRSRPVEDAKNRHKTE